MKELITKLDESLDYKVLDMVAKWKKEKTAFNETYKIVKDIKKTLKQEDTKVAADQAKSIAKLFAVFCWAYHFYGRPDNRNKVAKLLTIAGQQAEEAKDDEAYAIVKYVTASMLRGYGANKEAVTIMKQALFKLKGPSIAKAHALNNLALVTLRSGHATQAKQLLEQVAKLDLSQPSKNLVADQIIGTAEGEVKPRTQMNLSQVLKRLDDSQAAVKVAAGALDDKETTGAPKIDIAYARIVYTEALMQNGQYAEAEKQIKTAVATYQTIYGSDADDNFMRALICNAEVAHQLEKTQEATTHASEAFTMSTQLGYKHDHELPQRITDLDLLADVAQAPDTVANL